MPYKISETVLGHRNGIVLPVRVLVNDGTTARVRINACGMHLYDGQICTVPSSALQRTCCPAHP
jgi:hypothetical protein